jgi:Trk K+ transport system NAD-binding subunit
VDELTAQQATAIAPLLGIGCRSGDTVVGLSGVRRVESLAYIFADKNLAERTLRELQEQKKKGVRVFAVEDFALLTRVFGREDARVVGVKAGSLAAGIEKRLIKEGDAP